MKTLSKIILVLFLFVYFSPSALAAVTWRSNSYEVTASGQTVTASVASEATIEVGDLLIGHLTGNYAGATVTGPTGFTLIANVNAGGICGEYTWWKIADATDAGASATFSFQISGVGNKQLMGSVNAFYGHNPTTPINATSTGFDDSGSTTVSISSLTPTVANTMLAMYTSPCNGTANTSGQQTPNSGPTYTEQYDLSIASNRVQALATGIRPETTATGTSTATLSASRVNSGTLIAIAPLVTAARRLLGVGITR